MTQTIQRTGKPYKALILLGQLSMLASPFLFFTHHGAMSAAALITGLVVYWLGKIGAWWNNG
ncbi:hypothetical protein [Paraburkholderia acidisoli]|uniref:Uncharacterized protein n=1 Tax=Paraburkholderia acidisoli TaxID=2571748 RepID=A0A7Z2GR71_9BURK|nr:hypothetical protein [Paraburkholderia acidisoli]QGZ66265.1 hypothetical protein FAZ98_31175 [Paraburkholderia acidisoli]